MKFARINDFGKALHVPGAAQHAAKRSDALQNRDLREFRACNGPGSAAHREGALRHARDTGNTYV